jgi:hypothetical protein
MNPFWLTANSVPLKEFYLFPRLPAELRLKIYRIAITQVSSFPFLIPDLRAQGFFLSVFSMYHGSSVHQLLSSLSKFRKATY